MNNYLTMQPYTDLTQKMIPQWDVDSFAITVKKFFTTVDGTIIDKNTAPLELQVKYPVFLFNKFDSHGSYKISFNENPALPNTFFYRTYTQNIGFDQTQFSGLNTINRELNIGDQVFQYTDNLESPNFFIFIIQSITNRSLVAIVESIPCKGFQMGNLKYFSANRLNFDESVKIIKSNPLGIYKSDVISPVSMITPDYQQDRLALLPFAGNKLTPFWGLATYIQHDSDLLTFDFEFLNVD